MLEYVRDVPFFLLDKNAWCNMQRENISSGIKFYWWIKEILYLEKARRVWLAQSVDRKRKMYGEMLNICRVLSRQGEWTDKNFTSRVWSVGDKVSLMESDISNSWVNFCLPKATAPLVTIIHSLPSFCASATWKLRLQAKTLKTNKKHFV